MKRNLAIFLVMFVVTIMGLLLFFVMNSMYQNELKFRCEISRLEKVNEYFVRINNYEDSSVMCSSEECTNHFEERINNSLDSIENLFEFDCDKLVEELFLGSYANEGGGEGK